MHELDNNLLEELELLETHCLVCDLADLAEKIAPEGQLGVAIGVFHLEQGDEDFQKRAALLNDLVHLAESDLDEDMSELFSTLTVPGCDHPLDQLMQGLFLGHDHIDERSCLILGNPAIFHKLNHDARCHLQVVIIVSAKLLED